MAQKSMTTTYNTSTTKSKAPSKAQVAQKFKNAQTGTSQKVIKPAKRGK